MKHYFSSDFHFGHTNILSYDKRPFKDISHHDNAIIDNYNSIVQTDDNFYFLGDFSLTHHGYAERCLQRMNGIKYFIKGNHDKKDTIKLYKRYGTFLGGLDKITIDGQDINLCHYAMRVWNKSHRGAWLLYGHSHGGLETQPWGKSMDVCIILNNYLPFEFSEIKKIMDKREIRLEGDHHI